MARYKIEWSVESRLDLIDILDFFIKRNKSNTYSRKLYKKINNSADLLIKNPLLGIQTDIDSVRTLITGDYQIIYEIIDQVILIVMIWDCSQDPQKKRIDKRLK